MDNVEKQSLAASGELLQQSNKRSGLSYIGQMYIKILLNDYKNIIYFEINPSSVNTQVNKTYLQE